jgi:hypothetical protein
MGWRGADKLGELGWEYWGPGWGRPPPGLPHKGGGEEGIGGSSLGLGPVVGQSPTHRLRRSPLPGGEGKEAFR